MVIGWMLCHQDLLMKIPKDSVEKNEIGINENNEFDFNQDNSISSLKKGIEALVGIDLKKIKLLKWKKIRKLKKIFRDEKIDGYIIPKNDEFFGEYIPKYNDD